MKHNSFFFFFFSLQIVEFDKPLTLIRDHPDGLFASMVAATNDKSLIALAEGKMSVTQALIEKDKKKKERRHRRHHHHHHDGSAKNTTTTTTTTTTDDHHHKSSHHDKK